MVIDRIMDKIDDLMDRDRYGTGDSTSSDRPRRSRVPVKKLGIAGLALLTTIGYFGARHSVGETEVGVKFFKPTGQAETLPPGTHFFLPILNDWYKLETTLESTEMSSQEGVGDREKSDALQLKTRDGNDIALDLNITYRVDPTKAIDIIKYVGQSNEELREKIVRPLSRSIPRDHFGSLDSIEFANATYRNAAARATEVDLRETLAEYGIDVGAVNTGHYQFVNSEYAALVQAKKVADSALPAVVASLDAQTEENERALQEATKNKLKTIAEADGQYQRAVVAADGYFMEKQAAAEGILARGENRADAIRAEREAMMSRGGKTLVQMKIAECLQDKPIVYVPICSDGGSGMQLNTLDVNSFLASYGALNKAPAKGGN